MQGKLFVFLGFFALILFAIAAFGFYGIQKISESSRAVIAKEVPLTISMKEALVAMLGGELALEAALSVEDFSQIEDVQHHEADLTKVVTVFDVYIAALTWGSESEAFLQSEGGLNFAVWRRLGLADRFVIQRPDSEQLQWAGATDIYFGGFAHNAFNAIGAHKKFLRLEFENRVQEAEQAREMSRIHRGRALRLSGLATESISQIVAVSNAAILRESKIIEQVQRDMGRNILIVFLLGSAASLVMSYVFTSQLSNANTRLEELLLENYQSAKLLVQRDRELVQTNLALIDRNAELDDIAKMLVRRDLELTQGNERLRDLDVAKSQFVSVAAHQLRTPLAGIKWTLYALLEEKMGRLNKEQEKFAGDAYKATVRLIDLVNDLLDVARLEEGRFGFKIKKQPLAPLVKKVCENFQKAAKGKGIKFSLELPKEDIPFLDFDEEKIAIVLANLVDNAIKYTAPGGQVAVKLYKEKNSVRVEVADTGIGMPADQVKRVFTKFFRAENAQLYQTSGTGLGLYLAQNIVEHHGGAMFFKTEEDKGSTFTFSLPIPKSGIKKV